MMTPDRVWHKPDRPWSVGFALRIAWVMALAPNVSYGVSWNLTGSGHIVKICTATGASLVPADSTLYAADSPAGQESALSLSHCPFCLHTADRVAPPTYPVAFLFLDPVGEREAMAWQAFFFYAHFGFAPPPRGPPLLA